MRSSWDAHSLLLLLIVHSLPSQDWGGEQGQVKYPPFMNPQVEWAMADPIEQCIQQEHDSNVLRKGVDHVIRSLPQQRKPPVPPQASSRWHSSSCIKGASASRPQLSRFCALGAAIKQRLRPGASGCLRRW